jgi:membrane protein CcdC involved in cytochrome C biogenesis
MHPALIVTSVLGAGAVMAWRLRESSRPITARKIVIPPLGMSTGFSMFLYEPTRIPMAWAACALAAGALLLSYPLVKTSRLSREGAVVMLRRSRAFLWILLGLVAVRFAGRAYVERFVSPLQTGSIFFLLAFGMILPWRIAMLLEYRALLAAPGQAPPVHTT